MNKRVILWILIIIFITFIAYSFLDKMKKQITGKSENFDRIERSRITLSSEKTFFKKSDIGSDVFRLTTSDAEDSIFYQEPIYTSPNNKYFLFQSNRKQRYHLYLINLNLGEIILLRDSASFGWAPSWSKDGIVYVGDNRKIIKIDPETLEEKEIDVPNMYVETFLHFSPDGKKILMVEEEINFRGDNNHKHLSIINKDGSDYRLLYTIDEKEVFYLDHPIWVNNSLILFLTRGKNRDFTGDFNKPYLVDLAGKVKRIPIECSHYDVHPLGDKILCATEGYIISLDGIKLKEFSIKGHGVWHPDGKRFLMTGDPTTVPSGNHFGKIVLMDTNSDKIVNVVSHESTYNSTLPVHIQPNAQFSHDGNWIIYESDLNKGFGNDLYMVKIMN